jgi:hypothetical protein
VRTAPSTRSRPAIERSEGASRGVLRQLRNFPTQLAAEQRHSPLPQGGARGRPQELIRTRLGAVLC